MAKHLKLTIKNAQIAEAINLGSLKEKLAKKKSSAEEEKPPAKKASKAKAKEVSSHEEEAQKAVKEEGAPRVRARSKSVFAEGQQPPQKVQEEAAEVAPKEQEELETFQPPKKKTSEELRRQLFGEEAEVPEAVSAEKAVPEPKAKPIETKKEAPLEEAPIAEKPVAPQAPVEKKISKPEREAPPAEKPQPIAPARPAHVKLGPTGKHIKDLLPTPRAPHPAKQVEVPTPKAMEKEGRPRFKSKEEQAPLEEGEDQATARKSKTAGVKEFRDLKPAKKVEPQRTFDARDRQGLRDSDEDQRWRKRRQVKQRVQEEQPVIRPTSLKVRTPISIKDLAAEMKLKSAQLVAKLFLQGLVVTLNDLLEDETTIQLLGHEFGCEITIDTTEEKRIQVTDKTVAEEIAATPEDQLITRAPIVTFMGHVDHGKTSLIDSIRKSNRVSGEAGAITQHIGAFRCHTAVGDITILDTPGHEAFSSMRARGAVVTDIVVLVVAGDEGIKQQTIEAIEHARAAEVTIVVALNKSDKPNFNPDNVYRQLADQSLLPEVWGGQTLTVNCSAATGAGVKELLESLALQAEIMELKASPTSRARGTVLESELHKGMGAVATVLVQNGTLHIGDSIVFDQHWGRIKTMQDEFGRNLEEAPPSTPVAITGLSGVPEAGQDFIAVHNEREAREIAEARQQGIRQLQLQQRKKLTAESMVQQATPSAKKILNLILRADVQGSLEALRVALEKIHSDKAEVNIIFTGVGEISESDVQLALTSKAVILGFHTQTESHAESLMKQYNVQARLHNIIYHAVDDIKLLMKNLLDKIPQETDRGKAEIKAIFKSSQVGLIAGCIVTEGTIHRNHHIRIVRNGEAIGRAQISSLRRVKEDVREVQKGVECGISLTKFSDLQPGDILEAFEITYLTQEL